jgi:hypothetical protein
VRNCINGRTVDVLGNRKLADHRYFYTIGRVGRYACGIAREAAARRLRLYGQTPVPIGDLSVALEQYIDNPSVTGFMVEQAVLSWISTNGLASVDINLDGRMKPVAFENSTLDFSPQEQEPILYWPRSFNFCGIDRIVVRFGEVSGEKTCFMYPIQITLAKSHSDSEASFFKNWGSWIKGLECNVHVKFVWITTEGGVARKVDEKVRESRSGTRTISPAYDRVVVPLSSVSTEIWNRYEKARSKKGVIGAG